MFFIDFIKNLLSEYKKPGAEYLNVNKYFKLEILDINNMTIITVIDINFIPITYDHFTELKIHKHLKYIKYNELIKEIMHAIDMMIIRYENETNFMLLRSTNGIIIKIDYKKCKVYNNKVKKTIINEFSILISMATSNLILLEDKKEGKIENILNKHNIVEKIIKRK